MKTKILSILANVIAAARTAARAIGRITAPKSKRMPARCVNINALLLHLCDFDPHVYGYVLKWLAYPLRHPGAKMSMALVINGGQGTGKSLFFERVVAALYGDAARWVSDFALVSHFTPRASAARYVIVDGVLTARASQTLKHLLASQLVTINEKGQPARKERNEMNFVFIANSGDFSTLSAGSRRFAVVEAPPARDPQFYLAVMDEIENGGVDAFRDYLMNVIDLGTFNEYMLPPAAPRATTHMEAA